MSERNNRLDAQMLLGAELDGELDAEDSAVLAALLAVDPALRAERDRLVALRQRLAELARPEAPSAALRARIAAIGAPARPGFGWGQLAAAVLVGMVLGSGAVTLVRGGGEPPAPWRSVIAAHQQALLAPEPFTVASSDRHTVKPWFDHQIALSPQIVDLADQGFALAGGRIDEVAGRAVPTLIYRRREHVISVAAVPRPGSRDRGAAAQSASRDGYGLRWWQGQDFDYIAVSDLAADELDRFVALWRATPP